MASFTGVYSGGEVQVPMPLRTAHLSAYTGDLTSRAGPYDIQRFGGKAGTGAITVAPQAGFAGVLSKGFDGELFDKVLVIPRKKSLGFVLSPNIFPVEVWNTHRRSPQTMTAIAITGSGDLSIANPFSMPLTYWPLQSFTFTATVPQDGAAQINNIATFTFTGILGADLTLDGTRLAVFATDIDWSNGFVEGFEYRTAMLPGYSDMEQRVQLRTIPRQSARYRVLTLTARESAATDALIWARKSRIFGVPWWQDAQPLGADLPSGSLIVTVDPTSRPSFAAGALVMLWRDQFTYEALTIQAVGSTTITLATATTKAWAAIGTIVVPMKRGRLRAALPVARPGNFASSVELSFECEVV